MIKRPTRAMRAIRVAIRFRLTLRRSLVGRRKRESRTIGGHLLVGSAQLRPQVREDEILKPAHAPSGVKRGKEEVGDDSVGVETWIKQGYEKGTMEGMDHGASCSLRQ